MKKEETVTKRSLKAIAMMNSGKKTKVN